MTDTAGSTMRTERQFLVVLAANDEGPVPDWLLEKLSDEGIGFYYRECQTDDEVLEVAAAADIVWVITPLHILTAKVMQGLERCLAILRSGSGTDNVDVEAATNAGILVANTPTAVTETTSDHAIALLFSVVRRIPHNDRLVRAGHWDATRATPRRHLRGNARPGWVWAYRAACGSEGGGV